MVTAAYTAQKDAFGRQLQWLVEIDLDRCSLVYTQGDCTASDAGDGSRCWYSWQTCQAPAAYARTTRTWRFCLNDVPWPDPAVQVWPLLRGVDTVPQRIDAEALNTYPDKLRLEFCLDYDPPPVDHDKGAGYHNTARSGEFWRNLLARNRNYPGRAVRLYRGFNAPGFVLADFAQVGPAYKIREVQVDRDSCVITAESRLAELEKKSLPWTISEDNVLQTAIAATATAAVVYDATEFPDPDDYTRNSVYVRIKSCPAWTASTIVDSGWVVIPTSPNGYYYKATKPGTTHASTEPTWPTEVGKRVEDGTTKWECVDEDSGQEGTTVEICRVTARDTGTNTLTLVRGRWATTAAAHAVGDKVEHVVGFGTDNGTDAVTGVNCMDVMQDLLEWGGVAASDVATAGFASVSANIWTNSDIVRLITKPQKIADLMQQLREMRSVVLYLDADGKFATTVLGPYASPSAEWTDDNLVLDATTVTEDDDSRLTRAAVWYAPTEEDADKADKFLRGVVMVDSELETPNNFGDRRESVVYDHWLLKTTPAASVRNLCRRLITRLRNGLRTVNVEAELKDATGVHVGDHVHVTTRLVLGVSGDPQVLPCTVVSRVDHGGATTGYELLNEGHGGRFLRIAPDTAADYDDATEDDKAYGYNGDANNRVGSIKEPGYIYW